MWALPTIFPDVSGNIVYEQQKGGQLLDDFIVLHKEEFPDYKTARQREKFLKSGRGRKWLDEFESRARPA